VDVIKWGEADKILTAHCMIKNEEGHCVHGLLCRMNRTVRLNAAKPWQCKPLGYLIAWLRRGRQSLPATPEQHKTDQVLITHADRLAAREWVESTPAFESVLAKEDPVGGPEPAHYQ